MRGYLFYARSEHSAPVYIFCSKTCQGSFFFGVFPGEASTLHTPFHGSCTLQMMGAGWIPESHPTAARRALPSVRVDRHRDDMCHCLQRMVALGFPNEVQSGLSGDSTAKGPFALSDPSPCCPILSTFHSGHHPCQGKVSRASYPSPRKRLGA